MTKKGIELPGREGRWEEVDDWIEFDCMSNSYRVKLEIPGVLTLRDVVLLRRLPDPLPIIGALQQLMARVEDTRTALGSDLMHAANRGYALMQANGSTDGLEEALNEASYRYAKRRRKAKAEGET